MTETALLSAVELAQLIRDRKISSLELAELYIDRIEKRDEELNAVVVRDFDAARQTARERDEELASGAKVGPLHGVPMTIKEAYDIEGLPTTWGIPQLAKHCPQEDGSAVQKLKAAGAVFHGKSNVPLNLADFQSYNEIYGTTNNPWDVTRTPGGSSGGSAASLAAGFAGLECGSDIGGSIRNPAHYCGVFGHKPTYGVVPTQGHMLPGQLAESDLSVCGPLARSAEDLALAMDVLAGPPPLARPGWRLDLPRPEKTSLSDFKVAIWQDHEDAPVDREIADRVGLVADRLAAQGATVSDTARPNFDVSRSHIAYISLLNSIMSWSMPPDQYRKMRDVADQLDPDDHSRASVNIRSMTLSHRDWVGENNFRERLRYAWREFFEEWDILICPQMATTAFVHDHRPMGERTLTVNGEEREYFEQLFWAGLITVAYLPSTVFPTGLSAGGLPIGLQAAGPELSDYQTIEFTRLYAQEFGGFEAPPSFA